MVSRRGRSRHRSCTVPGRGVRTRSQNRTFGLFEGERQGVQNSNVALVLGSVLSFRIASSQLLRHIMVIKVTNAIQV